jgi:vitamin B12 transporter
LNPERARGWDAGLDWYAAKGRAVFGVSWFDTRCSDLIAGTADFRSVENIQRARTQGAEFSARFALGAGWTVRGNYTYLTAENLTTDRRLLRRPRHRGHADVWHDFGRGFSLGAGVAVTAQREDVDAATYRAIDGEDFTVVRAYAEYRLSARLAVKMRIENLLDEAYEEVNGYPALGTAIFAGAEWKF